MLVVRGKYVHTATLGTIENGIVVVDDGGRIAAVGKEGEVEVPPGADTLSGEHVTPGLIDPHTHIGVSELAIGWEGKDVNEITDPVTPHLRVVDGVKTDDEGFREALGAGVTTVGILPGSANPIGGLGAAFKCYGRHKLDMVLRDPVGLKVAFGENPKRTHGLESKRSPYTRMAIAAMIREWLVKAQNYARKKELFGDQPDKLPDRDLKLEALELVLRGEIPLRAHAHLADDILTAISIAEEFNVKIVLDHATEAYRIADVLAPKGIPAVVGPLLTSKYKVELRGRTTRAPALLVKAGVEVALTTDHPVVPIKLLPLQVRVAMSEGLSFEDALRSVTITAAKVLGVDDVVGSIEVGKEGDLVVLNGRPFEPDTRVLYTIVRGKLAFTHEEARC